MSEEKKMTIAKVTLGETKTGKTVAELYSDNMRLEYPELQLFDLSRLILVGIDPNDLEKGRDRWCRFTAYYVESDKENKNGNPYRDVVCIEPIDLPGADDAIVDKIRDLHATVTQLSGYVQDLLRMLEMALFEGRVEEALQQKRTQAVEQLQAATPPQMERDGATLIEPTPQERHKRPSEPAPVLDEEQSRRAFFQEANPAIKAGAVTHDDIKRWREAVQAGHLSWRDALAKLRNGTQVQAA